jgi:hypothetical protein
LSSSKYMSIRYRDDIARDNNKNLRLLNRKALLWLVQREERASPAYGGDPSKDDRP